jgi:hypothetical protein
VITRQDVGIGVYTHCSVECQTYPEVEKFHFWVRTVWTSLYAMFIFRSNRFFLSTSWQ